MEQLISGVYLALVIALTATNLRRSLKKSLTRQNNESDLSDYFNVVYPALIAVGIIYAVIKELARASNLI